MTQRDAVIDYLNEHGSITQKEAINELGIYRLASRMSELKKEGFKFKKEMVKVPTRYKETTYIARYSICVE